MNNNRYFHTKIEIELLSKQSWVVNLEEREVRLIWLGYVGHQELKYYYVSPYNCIYEYNNNLLDLYELFKLEVDSKKRKILNRMLYLSILSIYELFMADLSVTCFLRFDKIRDSFRKDTHYNNKNDKKIIRKIREEYYNRFKVESNNDWSVENHFKNHYDIDIPPSSCLEEAFKTRNDIAHRYNLNKYHNDVVEIKDKDIEELATETNKVVYELFEKLIGKVYTE